MPYYDCPLNVIDITGITATAGTTFDMTAANTIVPVNGRCYTLRLCQTLPVTGQQGNEPVTITIGATTYPVLDKIGNTLLSGRLRGRRRYRVVFGDNVSHFMVLDACGCLIYNANPTVPDVPTTFVAAKGATTK